ncbi:MULTISPECIES: chemotaxis response regulator protein-glutamate methylesterase [unclassified Fusibacter]|uniref:protein-glutamate methylesterase/protein-glutamine glutaminase n=1 Tax=unclassified Fusibacter TaxID=2624464 RepID=UPI001012925D|nr:MULTISPECIES: chemotaxis response regulator protein-glutamate methylesterase [unclassified Fusibacter]MCK8060406.1 chemotaxis response regulator protein-glutamate methylesterase [Fusibacter sp. A2]NPE20305.1 chemotaxis response regulator protein-glutamate methylesterase [Fusibacter sp. A1]RXV63511.1 chemotaxis response regulator protein-glutamate methylesterase [Fusibacter sp. A1]
MQKIKVLVIDDSMLFREALTRGLESDAAIKVVAKANDPYDAIGKIELFDPDVITCDVQMPKMDGIEFIRQLLPQHKVPVIVVSAIDYAVFDAMRVGAVDFVTKPDTNAGISHRQFIDEVIKKVKEASQASVHTYKDPSPNAVDHVVSKDINVIAIGASTGGTEAIYHILKGLPKNSPGIVVVQHIPPAFSTMFALRLDKNTHFNVKEAKTGDLVLPGMVLVAPGDQHLELTDISGSLRVKLKKGPKVSGHCPSVDVLFDSVAKVCKKKAIGVILTGMGYDGAKGLLRMKRYGAVTIGQNSESSVVYGMPKAAFEVGAVTKQASLELIAHTIIKYLK